MVKDDVFPENVSKVDYPDMLDRFTEKKALFLAQGQWAISAIINQPFNFTDYISLLPWPKLPGENDKMAGSLAKATQAGYGITKKCSTDPAVRDAALKFIKYYNSYENVVKRLRNSTIIAPVLKDFKIPEDLPHILKEKIALSNTSSSSEVIDQVLPDAANEALNEGIKKIIAGQATAEDVAAEIERLVKK
jgi:raffinose/stachyose/melibiose transport system substrate-binding protein